MGVSSLRQSNRKGDNTHELLASISSERLDIGDIEKRTVSPLCNDYPYPEQQIYTGDLYYSENPSQTRGRVINCQFEYRSGSGLFLLNSEVDFAQNEVVKEINRLSPEDFRIYRTLSPGRESLWSFVSNANRVIDLTFRVGPSSEAGLDEFQEKTVDEIVGKYPIESATAVYQHADRQILVRYSSGSIQIDTDDTEAAEFILQLFERDVMSSD